MFDTAYYTAQELGERLGAYKDSIDISPDTLERIRGRIDMLYRLKAKYGPTLEDVMAAGVRARQELDALDLAGFELKELAREEETRAAQLEKLAARLSKSRTKAAKALGAEVDGMLPELGMPDGRFEVALSRRPTIGSTGAEDVEFGVTLGNGLSLIVELLAAHGEHGAARGVGGAEQAVGRLRQGRLSSDAGGGSHMNSHLGTLMGTGPSTPTWLRWHVCPVRRVRVRSVPWSRRMQWSGVRFSVLPWQCVVA